VDEKDQTPLDEALIRAQSAARLEARRHALDRSAVPEERMRWARELVRRDTDAGKELVREIASNPMESDEMLTLAGRQLAMLMWAGAVSEFDMRDLTDTASYIVDTATPADLWSW
jgi:hypothetical protein